MGNVFKKIKGLVPSKSGGVPSKSGGPPRPPKGPPPPGARGRTPSISDEPTSGPNVVFASTNDIGSNMKYKRSDPTRFTDASDDDRGTCAVLSSLWLANMYTFTDPGQTSPNQMKAALIFQRNWVRHADSDPFNRDNISSAGLRVRKKHASRTITSSFNYITNNHGYYYVDLTQGHVIAAVHRGIDLFLFDPNYACWKYSRAQFLSDGLNEILDDWDDEEVDLYRVALE